AWLSTPAALPSKAGGVGPAYSSTLVLSSPKSAALLLSSHNALPASFSHQSLLLWKDSSSNPRDLETFAWVCIALIRLDTFDGSYNFAAHVASCSLDPANKSLSAQAQTG